ncbi:MAG: pyridoxal-phosphate dependent enzyme [Acidobacteria bacterium]|nr:pyridoxal-phosphate dependent enzyme [Acidobacteriota bacterium]
MCDPGSLLPDYQDIVAAAERIAPVAKPTPVLTSRTFNSHYGADAFFKCENFQLGGAFKIRGAANAIFSLPPEQRANGVVTYSSGNHAQATAIAARHAGIRATIVMPDDAPKSKLNATRGYGATVVLYDRMRENRNVIGERIAAETGATIVPPFDHAAVIAGQGTVAKELLEALPDLDTLVVCVGGGGLISGCAIAAKALRPGIRIYGVEPESADDFRQSIAAGRIIEIPPPGTIADGLRTLAPGKLTFEAVRQNVEEIVVVSDEEIREAMRFLLFRMKILAEPSGATATAAVMHGRLPAGLGRTGIVISGGNVDPEVLASVIAV